MDAYDRLIEDRLGEASELLGFAEQHFWGNLGLLLFSTGTDEDRFQAAVWLWQAADHADMVLGLALSWPHAMQERIKQMTEDARNLREVARSILKRI
jgi:hypothetical protein